jgi:glucose/arabinose dehydrogenase
MRLRLAAALGAALAALSPAAAAELPAPYATPVASKPARVVGWPSGAAPQAPPNFRVAAFARGLDNPRSLLVLPNGDVLVAESRGAFGQGRPSANRITLLRDSQGAGVADQQFALLDGLDRPYGLALRRDRLYVGDTDAVLSCPFLVGQTRLHGECRSLIELPSAAGSDHWTRNLVFSPDESRLYVSVGSSSNVDEDQRDAKDPRRAAILVARPDGSELRVYASGLRNPVGLAFEPVTGRLYTTVNERDLLGDELVPDFLTHVRDGAFYGWPYAYFGAHEDPRKKGERPDLVARAVVPDVALDAHAAALGLVFYGREQFPRSYRGGAFIALHGSWNRSTFAGYKVVHVPFSGGQPAAPPQDFLTGFIKDADTSEVYGRPAGLAVGTDGALLVADDAGNTVWRVTFKCAACTPEPAPPRPRERRRASPAVPAPR